MKNHKMPGGNQVSSFSRMIHIITQKLKNFFRQALKILTPDRMAWKSAAYGIAAVILILLLIFSFQYADKLGFLVSGLAIFYYAFTGVAAALGLFLILKLLMLLPDLYRWILVAAAGILFFFWPGAIPGKIILIVITILSASFVAGSAGMLMKKGWKRKKPANTIVNIVFLTTGLAAMIYGSYWMINKGTEMDMPDNAALQSKYQPEQITLPDPSEEGDYEVHQLCYGSGKDRHRDEFGKNVNIVTDSVDGSRFIPNWEKFHGWARTKYWGFGNASLPLNARVWYPGGNGPFPLVLIVHGNHLDRDFSDPGYEYLGRLMASRGFIFASVDENFLNSTWSDIFNRLKEENDCRAWLLLKHLEQWHNWNKDSTSPFFNKIDLGKIALIGHSRGGESVSIAAAFNQLPYYPDDATVKFNFGYKILSVIAIAPVDGQYKAARIPTSFNNVNYFVLQGSHDMDMQSYHGERQYHRIKFTDDDFHVKAGLYIWGANHGQFNTVWRRNDVGYPGIALFNTKQLLPEKEQMKIARVYISAFLEATLNKKSEYLELLRDYRSGMEWLPKTIYLNLYEDSNIKNICSFEEDIDLTTTTIRSGKISASNLTVWKERMVPLKWGDMDTRAVYTGWNKKEMDSLTGSYIITFDVRNELVPDTSDFIIFSIAESKESSNPYPKEKNGKNKKENAKQKKRKTVKESNITGEKNNGEKAKEEIAKKEKAKDEIKKDSIDFSIVLKDINEVTARLPLSHYAYLQPQLEAKITKAKILTKEPESEIVYQTFFFPLKDFANENPGFNSAEIKEIGFIFDMTDEGVVIFDNIGFWRK